MGRSSSRHLQGWGKLRLPAGQFQKACSAGSSRVRSSGPLQVSVRAGHLQRLRSGYGHLQVSFNQVSFILPAGKSMFRSRDSRVREFCAAQGQIKNVHISVFHFWVMPQILLQLTQRDFPQLWLRVFLFVSL